MKKVKSTIAAILFCFCNSCMGILDSTYEKHIIYDYYLHAIEDRQTINLSLNLENGGSIEVVEETIYAVGFNENYIILKQHPKKFGPIDKSVTNFYIVTIYKQNGLTPKKGVLGPFSIEEFREKQKELKLDTVGFTIVLKELE